jgi:hypothetical protein
MTNETTGSEERRRLPLHELVRDLEDEYGLTQSERVETVARNLAHLKD